MSNTSPGLKSLADRVNALEQTTGVAPVPAPRQPSVSFVDNLINISVSDLKNDLGTVLIHYEDGLKGLGIDLSNVKMVDLIKIVSYTVQYVETNIGIVAGIMKKDVNSSLKLNTAIALIRNYVQHDEQFLGAWISHETDLMFNKGSTLLENTLVNTKKNSLNTPTVSISKGRGKKWFSLANK